MKARIGIGFDSHALVAGRPCVLGGVTVPHPTGPLGHSDGDAVLHAIADAMLGAAGLEDLGTLFPDDDPRWKGAESATLLSQVAARVRAAGLRVENLDVVVATDGPRIAPHREAIRARVGEILGVDPRAVGIKGKSLEGFPWTPIARDAAREWIAVQAVCLLSEA